MDKDFNPTEDLNKIVKNAMDKIEFFKSLLIQIENILKLAIRNIREKIRPQITNIIDVLKNI